MADFQTLVLLPGLDGTDVFFRPLIALLPPSIRALPLSYPDDGPYDYQALLERLQRALAGVDRCYLLAASFSGPLAVMLAVAEPEKIRGVIIVASFLRAPRRHPRLMRAWATPAAVWTLRAVRRLPIWLLRGRQDAMRLAKRETWRRASARALAGRGAAVLGVDAREVLPRCRQPLLNVIYAGDRTVAGAFSREIVRLDSKTVILAGGHMGMFADPAPLAAEVMAFLLEQRRIEAGTKP